MNAFTPIDYGELVPGLSGLTAEGTTQIDAFILTKKVNVFASVPSGSGAVLPSSYSPGAQIWILNRDPANGLLIYPPFGDQIEANAVNAPITVAAASDYVLVCFDPPLALAPRTWWLSAFTQGNIGQFLPLIGGTLSGPLIVNSTLNVSGATTLAGGTFNGTFAGNHTLSGNVAIGGTFGVTGATTLGVGSASNVTITGGVTTTTFQANSGGAGGFNFNTRNGQQAVFNNQVNAASFRTPGNTFTLSGTTIPTPMGNLVANWTGTSTIVGNTALNTVFIGTASDTAFAPRSELQVGGNYGGVGFGGGRFGVNVNMTLNTPSTLTVGAEGLVGFNCVVASTVNLGGVGTGFGTTSFGLGSLFGSVPWARAATGATFLRQVVGQEIDASIRTGASALNFVVQQLVVTSDHAVPGAIGDTILAMAAQTGASAGVSRGVSVGSYSSQWPIDANGVILQVQSGANDVAVPTRAAGGLDLNQLTVSGTAAEGGGYYWRSPGVKVQDTEVEVGYGALANDANGMTIDASYQKMNTAAGAITVAAGGSNFTSGVLVGDVYGNIVRVTAVAGVVTGVSAVVTRGWQKSPPADPVPFTALTFGVTRGTGLTLNLGAWTAHTELYLQPNGGVVRAGSGMITANGTIATALTAVGPTGSHTTVQEWLTVTNAAGTVRYIPCF